MTDMLTLTDAQRVERADFDFLTQQARNSSRQLASAFLVSPSGQQAWVFGGFAVTNVVLPGPTYTKVLQVTRGTAILSTREAGQVVTGTLTSEGDATLQVDLTGYSNGLYNVYVRFQVADGTIENRVFWDPVAVGEFVQSVPTRKLAGWGVAVALTSPGGEWFKIGEVTVATSPPLTITQKRQLYFEGDEANSYITGWGGGNDRNADRAQYGVHDFHTFAAAMNQKLKEIQGHNWWTSTPEPLNNKVSKGPTGDTLSGTYTINGTLGADYLNVNISMRGSGTQDLGDATHKFNNLWLAGAGSIGTTLGVGTDLTVTGLTHGVGVATFDAILNANGGIRTNGSDDLAASGSPFVNAYLTNRYGAYSENVQFMSVGTEVYAYRARHAGSILSTQNAGVGFRSELASGTSYVSLVSWQGASGLGEPFTGRLTVGQPTGDVKFQLYVGTGAGTPALDFLRSTGSFLRVDGELDPSVDASDFATGWLLGDATHRWREVHTQRLFVYGTGAQTTYGNLIPDTGSAQNLGDSTHYWGEIRGAYLWGGTSTHCKTYYPFDTSLSGANQGITMVGRWSGGNGHPSLRCYMDTGTTGPEGAFLCFDGASTANGAPGASPTEPVRKSAAGLDTAGTWQAAQTRYWVKVLVHDSVSSTYEVKWLLLHDQSDIGA
jgi:hypothetical protein